MRWLAVALFALSLSAPALADGSGTLSGPGKIAVKSCGKDRDQVTWTVQLTGSTWASSPPGGGTGPFGTAAPVGSSGKIWNFAFDPGVKMGFDQFLAALASSLCETTVTLTGPSTVSQFNLKLNKRKTGAKLTLAVTATGVSVEGTGAGKLTMKLRGPWQEAP